MTARRRRRLLRLDDLAGLWIALAVASIPYLIALPLILCADLDPPPKEMARDHVRRPENDPR